MTADSERLRLSKGGIDCDSGLTLTFKFMLREGGQPAGASMVTSSGNTLLPPMGEGQGKRRNMPCEGDRQAELGWIRLNGKVELGWATTDGSVHARESGRSDTLG